MRADRHSSVRPALSPSRESGVKEYRTSAARNPASMCGRWAWSAPLSQAGVSIPAYPDQLYLTGYPIHAATRPPPAER
jgi:hypothetical protein